MHLGVVQGTCETNHKNVFAIRDQFFRKQPNVQIKNSKNDNTEVRNIHQFISVLTWQLEL